MKESFSTLEKQEAYRKERTKLNRQRAIDVVARNIVPKSSNIVGSHVIYRRKPDVSVKGSIVPWGHRDY